MAAVDAPRRRRRIAGGCRPGPRARHRDRGRRRSGPAVAAGAASDRRRFRARRGGAQRRGGGGPRGRRGRGGGARLLARRAPADPLRGPHLPPPDRRPSRPSARSQRGGAQRAQLGSFALRPRRGGAARSLDRRRDPRLGCRAPRRVVGSLSDPRHQPRRGRPPDDPRLCRGDACRCRAAPRRLCRLRPEQPPRRRLARRGLAGNFARGYNGPGFEQNAYHTKLATAYAKWSRIA